jgi:hypothetical protein
MLKLAIVPVFILGISLAGQRWGPAVAGWLSGLPVIAGPILFFIAREQGTEFAAQATIATLSALCGALAFSLAYTWAAQRHAWLLCFLAAALAYSATVFALYLLAPGLILAAALSIGMIVAAPRLFPSVESTSAPPAMTRTELLVRMIAGATMVLLATHFAGQLGPRLSGLVAMFPILGSVLAVFTHRHAGAAFTTKLLSGMALGFYAFVTFCVVLTLTLREWGIGLAFGAATIAALAVQSFARLWMTRGLRAIEAR